MGFSLHRDHFALLRYRAGVDDLAGFLVDGQRLPGEHRLIHAQILSLDELGIGGDDIAEPQANDVTGHQLGGGESPHGTFQLLEDGVDSECFGGLTVDALAHG